MRPLPLSIGELKAKPLRIGLDFDNTLVCYDGLIWETAINWGLISPKTPASKQVVRDTIRELPAGETHWRQLQGYIYGRGIQAATPYAGAVEFWQACQQRGIPTVIISHKTHYATEDETRTDLQASALTWLIQQGFVTADNWQRRVWFGETRAEKLAFIAQNGCTHFVDDLVETFEEEAFPAGVQKILFDPHQPTQRLPQWWVASHWEILSTWLLNE